MDLRKGLRQFAVAASVVTTGVVGLSAGAQAKNVSCIANVCSETGRMPGGTYINNNGHVAHPGGLPSDAYVIQPNGTRRPIYQQAPQRLPHAVQQHPVAPQQVQLTTCTVRDQFGQAHDYRFKPSDMITLQQAMNNMGLTDYEGRKLAEDGDCGPRSEFALDTGIHIGFIQIDTDATGKQIVRLGPNAPAIQ